MTPARSIEEQFEPDVALKLRLLQWRLEGLRTTGEASDYFIFEALSCLDRGLLLATLQLVTATLELRAREILIQNTIADLPDRRGPAYQIEISLEEDRGYPFSGILAALETRCVISSNERRELKRIYQDIRIPLHHGIVGRYSRSREGERGDWVLEALLGENRVHFTTSERWNPSFEKYGVEDLDHVICGLGC